MQRDCSFPTVDLMNYLGRVILWCLQSRSHLISALVSVLQISSAFFCHGSWHANFEPR